MYLQDWRSVIHDTIGWDVRTMIVMILNDADDEGVTGKGFYLSATETRRTQRDAGAHIHMIPAACTRLRYEDGIHRPRDRITEITATSHQILDSPLLYRNKKCPLQCQRNLNDMEINQNRFQTDP